MTEIKSAKIDEDIVTLISELGINFSGETNNYFKNKLCTIKGLDKEIDELEKRLIKLKDRREKIWNNKIKMTIEEKKYLIETGEAVSQDIKVLKPRIRAIYNKFGKIIESKEELFKLVEIANGRN